jgi:hypothetical protein
MFISMGIAVKLKVKITPQGHNAHRWAGSLSFRHPESRMPKANDHEKQNQVAKVDSCNSQHNPSRGWRCFCWSVSQLLEFKGESRSC